MALIRSTRLQIRPVPSLDLSAPEISIIPKPDQAEDNGLPNNRDIGYIIDVLVDGAYTSDYFYKGDKIDLTVMSNVRHDLLKTEDLGKLKDRDSARRFDRVAKCRHDQLHWCTRADQST